LEHVKRHELVSETFLGNHNSAKIEICQKSFRGHIKNAFYDVPSKEFAEQLTLRWLKHCGDGSNV
jgi:hypothetical protein